MGEASARFLARAGCDVALVDLVPERAEQVAGMVNGIGAKAVTVIGDVLDDAQIPRIVAEAEEKLGGLDRMVSIVGAAAWGSLLETTADGVGPANAAQPALLLSDRERSRQRR